MNIDPDLAYLVRREPYKYRNIFLDAFLTAGDAFNPNALYNHRRLIIPGKCVIGEFENAGSEQLILKGDLFFVDSSVETVRRYERYIREGKLNPEQQWHVTDDGLQSLLNQLRDYVTSLRRGQQGNPIFTIYWEPATKVSSIP